jgi:hypothetical protein
MKRPQIQQTILLSFLAGEFNKYIYLPFEVDEIIINNGHQIFTNNIRFMTINSNLFGIGSDPIPIDTFDFLNGYYGNTKQTSIQFTNTTPINGSYNFSFVCKDINHNIISPSALEVKLEFTFIKY